MGLKKVGASWAPIGKAPEVSVFVLPKLLVLGVAESLAGFYLLQARSVDLFSGSGLVTLRRG